MDIQNSRDFPITKLKSQKPADDSHKHGEQVVCLSVCPWYYSLLCCSV
jgi:hypothetical protein